ncbi:MAG: hypothetical protein IKN59_07635 [Paludibacteraceae bacterium]|nr:hypothetical protein [Paludibacteraceae bacterium]
MQEEHLNTTSVDHIALARNSRRLKNWVIERMAGVVYCVTLTQAQYDALVEAQEVDETTLYIISDAE